MKQLVINEELTGILHKCINDINNSRFEFNELVDKDFSLSKRYIFAIQLILLRVVKSNHKIQQ